MAYSRADLDIADRHVAEGGERIARLMERITEATFRGHPTHLAETALATMRVTLNLMIDHRREIAGGIGSQTSTELPQSGRGSALLSGLHLRCKPD